MQICHGRERAKNSSGCFYGPSNFSPVKHSPMRCPSLVYPQNVIAPRLCVLRPKLHHTDTSNERAHNSSTTNLSHRNARAQHLDMSRCWDVANFCLLVVVTLLDNKLSNCCELVRGWWCPLVVSVAGKMLYNKFSRLRTCCTTYNLSVGGVRW